MLAAVHKLQKQLQLSSKMLTVQTRLQPGPCGKPQHTYIEASQNPRPNDAQMAPTRSVLTNTTSNREPAASKTHPPATQRQQYHQTDHWTHRILPCCLSCTMIYAEFNSYAQLRSAATDSVILRLIISINCLWPAGSTKPLQQWAHANHMLTAPKT